MTLPFILMFQIGDAVDMSTVYGWAFCGIVKSVDDTHCWVHFIYSHNPKIPYERLGAWYKRNNLRFSHNPPID